jgi:hypothetical protein
MGHGLQSSFEARKSALLRMTAWRTQQPRRMLVSLRSTSLFSSVIAASPLRCGPVISVRDPPDLAEPVVTPLPVLALLPDHCAVPEELVPGARETRVAFGLALAEKTSPISSFFG